MVSISSQLGTNPESPGKRETQLNDSEWPVEVSLEHILDC